MSIPAKSIRAGLGALIFAVIIGAPWYYFEWRSAQTRNFRVVREGVLYRSGQLTVTELRQLAMKHGIRTVITFRGADIGEDSHPDAAEEAFCRRERIKHVRIPVTAAWSVEGNGQESPNKRAAQFHKIVSNPENHPVLVHCYAGRHRTGAFCAIYRVGCEHWTNEDAIDEMKRLGYGNVEEHPDIYQFLRHYQPN